MRSGERYEENPAVTPDLWPAPENLFGKSGASDGCGCIYWRIGSAYRKSPRGANREALRKIVKRGAPPDLLAFDGDLRWAGASSRRTMLDHLCWNGVDNRTRGIQGGRSPRMGPPGRAARS